MAKARKRRALLMRGIVVALVAAAVAGVSWWRARGAQQQAYSYLTKPVKKGDLHETVTATGTLKGLDSVDVGAQISGRVTRVLADFNEHVTEGQVLAEIDPEQLASRVEQAKSQVAAADASLRLAKATAAQSKAEADRAEELAQKGLLSSRDLEAAQADAERAAASVAASQAQGRVSRASLKDAQTALTYATIRSPIDGIVLSRNVEPGQTVAASLQAPVLFTLARDLTKLALYVDIDEADVGKVREGQAATFSVDAWPNKRFSSQVVSVRNLPTAGQTVVTYQAVLSADNSEKLLRPGMTATATIITSEQKGVVLIPNAALRFTPPAEAGSANAPGPRLPLPGLGMGRRGFGGPHPASSASAPSANEGRGTVYTLVGGVPHRQSITTGGTDGTRTEVLGNVLHEGQQVIVDVEQKVEQ